MDLARRVWVSLYPLVSKISFNPTLFQFIHKNLLGNYLCTEFLRRNISRLFGLSTGKKEVEAGGWARIRIDSDILKPNAKQTPAPIKATNNRLIRDLTANQTTYHAWPPMEAKSAIESGSTISRLSYSQHRLIFS